MGNPAGRVTDLCGGSITTSNAVNVKINGLEPATLNSKIAGHGDSPHSAPIVVSSSNSVFSGGIGLSKAGDVGSCGHSISTYSSNVNIGA